MEVGSSGGSMGPQMYAFKKAQEVQEQNVLKVLESAQQQTQQVQQTQQSNTAALTGLGNNLNIKA